MESPSPSHKVIAIDGPAASGKSTVARLLARRLGFVYVNTGAMYRAVTWLALRHGVDPADGPAVAALLEATPMECGVAGGESTLRLDGADPTPHLNDPAVTANVSAVAAIPAVRAALVARQRAYGEAYDLVMEGRDIGTVVFPCTPFKAYIDASEEVRARRRAAQGIRDNLAARDRKDSTRAAAPLKIAEGAHVIDSTLLSVEGTVDEVVRRLGL
ncbi:MAG: (d)CMP kinase [Chthoniobacteraceae bacterium]|nr:(d)CMP kinase [Chthoniobacteraceae bacterium]